MKKIIIGITIVSIITSITIIVPKLGGTKKITIENPAYQKQKEKTPEEIRAEKIREYLEKKESPLAEHSEKIAGQKNWKLLIALSSVESQFCRRKVAFNCWGLGGDSNYQKYAGYDEAIEAAEMLIEKFHKKGRWHTPEDMIGSYVVPGSARWLSGVKNILAELSSIN